MKITRKNEAIIELAPHELEKILREHFDLGDEVKIEVRYNQENWIKVPHDNVKRPSELKEGTEVEVKFRNGTIRKGCAGDWNASWQQENHEWDIVEYRIL